MKPFRKHLAISVDGGGIRGAMVTRALEVVEKELGQTLGQVAEMAAGTSTGSIIAAGIALNLPAAEMTKLYQAYGNKIFARTWRNYLWPLLNYRYSNGILQEQLNSRFQNKKLGDLWTDARKFDLVIITRDLHQARTCFMKSWKLEYQQIPITTAVLASAAAPTYFPVIEGRYVDGGVGSFANPSFIAAYEARFHLNWPMEETTLISLGTGKPDPAKSGVPLHAPERYRVMEWMPLLIDTFMSDASDQQPRIVDQLFPGLDFRRFQIPINPISLDDVAMMDQLLAYGDQFGKMILNDQTDTDLQQIVYALPDSGG